VTRGWHLEAGDGEAAGVIGVGGDGDHEGAVGDVLLVELDGDLVVTCGHTGGHMGGPSHGDTLVLGHPHTGTSSHGDTLA